MLIQESPQTIARIDEMLRDDWQVWATISDDRPQQVRLVDGDRIVIDRGWPDSLSMIRFDTPGVTYHATKYELDPINMPSWAVRGAMRGLSWMLNH